MPKAPATLYVLSGTGLDPATGAVTEPYRRYVVYTPWATSASTGLPETPVLPPGGTFHLIVEVGADATLRVREAISIDFRGAHQGFFRTIPVRYERHGLEFSLRVDDVHAFDDNVAPLRTEVSRFGRGIRIKAWVPGAVDATRTVLITYRVRRALIDVDGHEELYWNVTGTEWDVPIRQAEGAEAAGSAQAGEKAEREEKDQILDPIEQHHRVNPAGQSDVHFLSRGKKLVSIVKLQEEL